MKKFILFIIAFYLILMGRSFALNNKIIANQDMSFGTVQYKDSPSIYRIDENNTLQSNNKANNYNSNAKLAVITVYGDPGDEVSLSFGTAKLSGNAGEITLSDIGTLDGNNTVRLDSTGKASVEITGTLNINNQHLIGQYIGTFVVWGSYKNKRLDSTVFQRVSVSASLLPNKASTLKSLNFGTIVFKRNASCHVTISTSNAVDTNCISVTGAQRLEYAGTTLWLSVPMWNLAVILPLTATLIGPKGDKLTISNFNVSGTINKATLMRNYTFYIGATLTIPSNAKGGTYSGTYDVTIML